MEWPEGMAAPAVPDPPAPPPPSDIGRRVTVSPSTTYPGRDATALAVAGPAVFPPTPHIPSHATCQVITTSQEQRRDDNSLPAAHPIPTRPRTLVQSRATCKPQQQVWYAEGGRDKAWHGVVTDEILDEIKVRFDGMRDDDPDKEFWVSRADDEWAYGDHNSKTAAKAARDAAKMSSPSRRAGPSANSPKNSPKKSPEVELYSARVHVANAEEWREVVMAACDAAANPAPAAEGGARAAAQQARAW